jgi:hypothetical protein
LTARGSPNRDNNIEANVWNRHSGTEKSETRSCEPTTSKSRQRQRLPGEFTGGCDLCCFVSEREGRATSDPHARVHVTTSVGRCRSKPVPTDCIRPAGRRLSVGGEHPRGNSPHARLFQLLLDDHKIACEPVLEFGGSNAHVFDPEDLRPVLPLLDRQLVTESRPEPVPQELCHGARRNHRGRESRE